MLSKFRPLSEAPKSRTWWPYAPSVKETKEEKGEEEKEERLSEGQSRMIWTAQL